MEHKLTVKQALQEGYTFCGYEGSEWQRLMEIEKLQPEDWESGKLMLFDKESQSTTIDAEDIREMIASRVVNIREDETQDDDAYSLADEIEKMDLSIFEPIEAAVNNILEKHQYYMLTKIELMP